MTFMLGLHIDARNGKAYDVLMKAILILIWLSAVGGVSAANTNYLYAEDVLKADGTLAITDGSSFYVFKSDGSFRSFPVGISGRCFEGTWKSDLYRPTRFTVTAKVSWENGIQPLDDYRRIVFIVYGGHKRPAERHYGGTLSSNEVFDCYFIIDELTKIPKPDKG